MDIDQMSADITNLIVQDLLGRSGFDAWYYDMRSEVRKEMKESLDETIADYLEAHV